MFKRQIIIILVAFTFLLGSGGYDHGTATGKGQLEIDLTWNPFDLIEFGQTYIVAGFGITNCFDLHAYFAHQTDGDNNFYYGLFYQFLETKYIDLATAVGLRQYTNSSAQDIFVPQLLYTIKMKSGFSIGGAFITVQRLEDKQLKNKGTAFDMALYIPLNKILPIPKFVDDIKLAIGIFSPTVFDATPFGFFPTYSVDIKFKKFY